MENKKQMYKYSNILVLFVIGALFIGSILTGCENETDQAQAYPINIEDYVAKQLPELKILQVELINENNFFYLVTLSNGDQLLFDIEGDVFSHEAVEKDRGKKKNHDEDLNFEDLPTTIQEYINTHYPAIDIDEIELEDGDIYEIELENDIELYFSLEGEILYVEDNEDYQGDNDNDAISLSDLPTGIVTHIEENYSNHRMVQADFLSEEQQYKVRLTKGIELYFDQASNFIYEETEFRLSLSQLEFPDTVKIGTTVEFKAYLINRNVNTFHGDIAFNYGVEDVAVVDETSTQKDGDLQRTALTIEPQDSLEVIIPIDIDEADFYPASYDIVIVWPEVTTADIVNPFVSGDEHEAIETFVEP